MLGATATRSRQGSNSDHGAFNEAGLAGINVAQDPIEYDSYTWHTNLDTYERIVEEDVIKSAIVVAATVYHLAMRPEPLPRFPRDQMPRRPGAGQNDARSRADRRHHRSGVQQALVARHQPSRLHPARHMRSRPSWRPASGRHNIWEIVVHAAYWKYAAARRFTEKGEDRFR